jgi:serine/threonine-protein kinase PRP4
VKKSFDEMREPEGKSEQALLEERRARRAAIIEKHRLLKLNQLSNEVNKKPTKVEKTEEMPKVEPELQESSPARPSFDVDIFGENTLRSSTGKKTTQVALADNNLSLVDNWDDPDGYYKLLLNEVLDSRYKVRGSYGRGVFSTVLMCDDLESGTQVRNYFKV